jgi:hypothetical protein
MLTEQQIRDALKSVYPGKKWAKRVDNMTDDQALAIYLNLKSQDKI